MVLIFYKEFIMPQKKVSVKTKISDSYEVDIATRKFTMKIDQPAPTGRDTAPTPLEFFLSALGGCICTIGKIVAYQQNIVLRGIEVEVSGQIDTDFLLGQKTDGRAGFTEIVLNVRVDADLTFEEKTAFIHEVERRCPISENIVNQSVVKLAISE
jgi:uncharacterized OsmC-like protein